MLKMVTITIGAGYDTNGAKLTWEQYESHVSMTHSLLCDIYGGCTILGHDGSWKNDDGEVVRESGVTIKTAVDAHNTALRDVLALGQNLATIWNQESVMVEYNGGVSFVGQ